MKTAWALLLLLLPFSVFWGCSSPLPTLVWEHTGGPYAQDVTALLPDWDIPLTVYAGHSTGAFSISSDQGRTWKQLSVVSPASPVYRIVQHPEQRGSLFAATGAGLYLSTDGGQKWRALPAASGLVAVRSFAIDPFDPHIMYAGIDGRGIHQSIDGGSTWTRCALPADESLITGAQTHAIIIDRTNPDRVYAALSRVGIATSSDRGKSWKTQIQQLATSGTVPMHLVIHARNPQILCFGTEAGDIYRTTNGGSTWAPVRQGRGTARIGSLIHGSASHDTLYASTEAGIITSPDFGATWSELAHDLPRIPFSLVAATDGRPILYVFGEGIGVKRSADYGRTWQPADRGLGGSTVNLITTDHRNSRQYCAVGGAVFLHNPATNSWVSASSGLHGNTITAIAYDRGADSVMYAGTGRGMFLTTDAGIFWRPAGGGFGTTPVGFLATHPAIGTRMFLQTSHGLHVSTDRGASWSTAKPPGNLYDIRSMTFSPRNSGMAHAATRNKGIVGSADGGLSWEPNRYGLKGDDVLAIAYDATDLNLMFAWTTDGAGYRSTNRGLEWERYAAPWKPGDHLLISVKRTEPHKAAALVNRQAVFVTMNAGATWKSIETAPLTADVLTLHWTADESMLLAGTRDQGVYRLVLGQRRK